MKRIDFENGNTTSNLLNAAFPMLGGLTVE